MTFWRNKRTDIKNIITKMQTQTVAIKTRMDDAEEWINDRKDKIMVNNSAEKKRESKLMDHEGWFRGLRNLLK